MSKAGVICVFVNASGTPYNRSGIADATAIDPLHITIGFTTDKEKTRRSIKNEIKNTFVQNILTTTWRAKEVYRPKIGGKSIVINTISATEANNKLQTSALWLQDDRIIDNFVVKDFFDEEYDTSKQYGKEWQRWEHVEVANTQSFVFPQSFRLVFAFMANRTVDYVFPLSSVMLLGCSVCGKQTHLMHPETRQVLCSEACLKNLY